MNDQLSTAYQAALDGCVYYPQPEAGIINLMGQDRYDFLQRQSTNDLSLLSQKSSIVTVLTSATARILDVLRVIQKPDHLQAISLPGYHDETFNYLKSRIFFMDQVEIEDISSQYAQFDLLGPLSTQLLQDLGVEGLPAVHEFKLTNIAQIPMTIIGQDGLSGDGFRLIVPKEKGVELETHLITHGSKRLEARSFHILRVEAGLAGAGAELSDQYNPLEVGLEKTVSDSKGCYTGQEILARQITYDKVARQMVGLKLDSPAEVTWDLTVKGRTVGSITSTVISPRFGPIALGVVRRSHSQSGTLLDVEGPAGSISATVTELPFQH